MANELSKQQLEEKAKGLTAYLMAGSSRASLAQVMPKTMSPDRMLKIALAAASRTPKLLECTKESFYIALHSCAQLGLEPNTPLGAAYLVPYFNGKTKQMEVQFQPGYRGLIDLARRSGQISTIFAYPVRKGDLFKYRLGLDPDIQHEPVSGPEAELTHVYAVAKLKDDGVQFVVMTRAEVEAIRQRSKAKDFGPWTTDYEQMALKTAIKRLCKYLPMTIEIADVVDHDNAVEYGDMNLVVDATTGEVKDEGGPAKTSKSQQMAAKYTRRTSAEAVAKDDVPDTQPAPELGTSDDLAFGGNIPDDDQMEMADMAAPRGADAIKGR